MEKAQRAQDLGAVFDAHMKAEFVDRDLDATMATMVAEPHLTHVPVLTGGTGGAEVRSFYGKHFVGHWPPDTKTTLISRTVGQGRLVDEFILSFTHTVEMDAIVPGIAPTGRKVEAPTVVICGFEGDKIAYEHIYWDQATILVQLGVLPSTGLPVSGAEQSRRLLDPTQPANQLIRDKSR
jgi:carboxymethylenebutenolidase